MNFTLKQIVSIIIAMVGLLGIVLLVVCAEMFKQFAYESEKNSLSESVGIKVTDLLKELERRTKEMGGYLQQDQRMRDAASNRDRETINRLLNDQFFQYYTTAGILRIARIYVFDVNFNLTDLPSEISRKDALSP